MGQHIYIVIQTYRSYNTLKVKIIGKNRTFKGRWRVSNFTFPGTEATNGSFL